MRLRKEIPKADVAGSIPVARSNDDAGLQATCSPAFALLLPLFLRFTPNFAHASHGIPCRWARVGSCPTCDVETRGWTSPSGHSNQLARGWSGW